MSSDDQTTPRTQPPSAGWTSVDDYNALPQRFADTGWGRPSFFQNILNIAENRHTRRQPAYSPAPHSPPGYPFTQQMHSSSSSYSSSSPPQPSLNMAHRSGFIDLTAEAGPSTKRIRRNDGSSHQTSSSHGESAQQTLLNHEQDATDGLARTLQKQQAEAVKAQEPPSNKALRISNLTCIICLDSPKDLTATACGHWFCHTCLMEALIAGENRTADSENRRSQCPVCRKTLSRHKATDVFPALLMKGIATQPRRKASEKTKA